MPISAARRPVQEPTVRVESDVDAAVTLMTLDPPLQLALCVPPDVPLAGHLQRLSSRDLTVVVTRRGSGLQLAVADGFAEHPRLVRMRPPRRGCPLDERGRGLQAVAGTATAWGSLPTPLGKVVWPICSRPTSRLRPRCRAAAIRTRRRRTADALTELR